ncbi:hypothetical protein BJX61DRAFT_491693 [Aspergillus egyptiacus]|nr:hypothetical protein BJX61DRAFT_491693 [Aspergillus egyptiacus]
MSLVQSCKIAAREFISCCDRQIDPSFSHRAAAPTKHTFSRLKTWKNTSSTDRFRSRWARKLPLPAPQHGEDTTDESSDECAGNIMQNPFTYDVVVFGQTREKVVYRRLLLDFRCDFNLLSSAIQELLGLPVSPYDGSKIRLPNGAHVKPIGTLEMKWQFYNGKKTCYKTEFLVIQDNDSYFDMLLGRASIREYKLWEEDTRIRWRLQRGP